MEITKSLQDDIVKIQNELITAIQNHQVLVLRQQVTPSESIKTQIEEVQRHIICLGESQKILVTRLRNELEPQRAHNKHKSAPQPRAHIKSKCENDRFNNKAKSQDLNRSLLMKNVNSREQPLQKTPLTSDSDNVVDRKTFLPKERPPSVDSSSEENRTPCESPVNGNSDNEQRGVKRPQKETYCHPNKRPKSTLQATPRPSSPVPASTKSIDGLSTSSEESLDSLISQNPESQNKGDFFLALGLVTKEVCSKVIKKKSERRRRRVGSNQHHLYTDLWDLTVLQKRNRPKDPDTEDIDDCSRDCATPQSDSDNLCFICRKPGDLRECRVCQTGCHPACIIHDICPACTHQASSSPSTSLVAEKKKELEQLRLSNKELHKSVSKLRERAKVLSASLVMQTATVTELVSKEDKLRESIKRLKDFVLCMQPGTTKPAS